MKKSTKTGAGRRIKSENASGPTSLRSFCYCCFSCCSCYGAAETSIPSPNPPPSSSVPSSVRSVSWSIPGAQNREGQQHLRTAGNSCPASQKQGSHRHRQGKRNRLLFQRSMGTARYMGSENPSSNTSLCSVKCAVNAARNHSKIRADLSGTAHRRAYPFPTGFTRKLQRGQRQSGNTARLQKF